LVVRDFLRNQLNTAAVKARTERHNWTGLNRTYVV